MSTRKVSTNQSLKKNCWTPSPSPLNGTVATGDPGPNGSTVRDESSVSATDASPQGNQGPAPGNGRLIRSMAMHQVRLIFMRLLVQPRKQLSLSVTKPIPACIRVTMLPCKFGLPL